MSGGNRPRGPANLDGPDQKTLLVAEGNLTGIAYAELPATPAAIRPV
jgi:hypothetical protein